MKPFNESSRSKKSRNCLKTMLNRLLVTKCDMHKKVNLKESIESSTLCSAKNPSMNLSKDARLIMCKLSLMMLELTQGRQNP